MDRKWAVILISLFLLLSGVVVTTFSDDDDSDDKGRYKESYDKDSDSHRRYLKRFREEYIRPVSDPVYQEECGACHFAYQAEFLPTVSWKKILAQLEDHFGEDAELDPTSEKAIKRYLTANSAEKSSTEISIKIMRSLRHQAPMRITKIPYILREHREIDPEVLDRESIGSLANCTACHTTAAKGIYEDDFASIPRK